MPNASTSSWSGAAAIQKNVFEFGCCVAFFAQVYGGPTKYGFYHFSVAGVYVYAFRGGNNGIRATISYYINKTIIANISAQTTIFRRRGLR